jgi:Phytanoyl-CoA dioxygenase (PhyH)
MTEDAQKLADACATFDEQGFYIWRECLPADRIDAHLERFDGSFPFAEATLLKDADAKARSTVNAIRERYYYQNTSSLELSFYPTIDAFLRRRFAGEPVLRHIGTHYFSLQSHIHTDCHNTAAPVRWQDEVRIWCALEEIDVESGPIYVYPGSHRRFSETVREEMLAEFPEYHELLVTDHRINRESWSAWYKHLTQLTTARMDELGIDKFIPTMNKGDVLFFAPALVHGTAPTTNERRTRKVLLASFYKSGVPFFKPGAFWGATHDWRKKEYEIHFETERTSFGRRVINYMKACDAINDMVIVRPLGKEASLHA